MINFVSYIKARKRYIQWNVDDVRLVLDQHTLLFSFCNANSLKEPSAAGKHVAPLEHIIMFPNPSVFTLID